MLHMHVYIIVIQSLKMHVQVFQNWLIIIEHHTSFVPMFGSTSSWFFLLFNCFVFSFCPLNVIVHRMDTRLIGLAIKSESAAFLTHWIRELCTLSVLSSCVSVQIMIQAGRCSLKDGVTFLTYPFWQKKGAKMAKGTMPNREQKREDIDMCAPLWDDTGKNMFTGKNYLP